MFSFRLKKFQYMLLNLLLSRNYDCVSLTFATPFELFCGAFCFYLCALQTKSWKASELIKNRIFIIYRNDIENGEKKYFAFYYQIFMLSNKQQGSKVRRKFWILPFERKTNFPKLSFFSFSFNFTFGYWKILSPILLCGWNIRGRNLMMWHDGGKKFLRDWKLHWGTFMQGFFKNSDKSKVMKKSCLHFSGL